MEPESLEDKAFPADPHAAVNPKPSAMIPAMINLDDLVARFILPGLTVES